MGVALLIGGPALIAMGKSGTSMFGLVCIFLGAVLTAQGMKAGR